MAALVIEIDQYLTTKQVAERLHVTDDCVRKWLSRGLLRRTKAHGRTLVSERDLRVFLSQSTDGPQPQAPDRP